MDLASILEAEKYISKSSDDRQKENKNLHVFIQKSVTALLGHVENPLQENEEIALYSRLKQDLSTFDSKNADCIKEIEASKTAKSDMREKIKVLEEKITIQKNELKEKLPLCEKEKMDYELRMAGLNESIGTLKKEYSDYLASVKLYQDNLNLRVNYNSMENTHVVSFLTKDKLFKECISLRYQGDIERWEVVEINKSIPYHVELKKIFDKIGNVQGLLSVLRQHVDYL